jgi:hypothetical protein
MSRYGVILAISDLPETIDVFELQHDLWVEKHMATDREQGKLRKLYPCNDAATFGKLIELPQFVASVFSDGEGVWGPMKPEYIRESLTHNGAQI